MSTLTSKLARLRIGAPARWRRRELATTVWSLRRDFVVAGVLSLVANALMLTPTLYMLQIYDRVMVSQNETTLLAVSLMTLALFGVLAGVEWLRTRVLVDAGVDLDQRLGPRIFDAAFRAQWSPGSADPVRPFDDLLQLRQFLTGQGILAFFDAPWTPLYLGMLWLLHPWLGGLGLGFVAVQAVLTWLGHHRTLAPTVQAGNAAAAAGQFLQDKLRHADLIECMGMLGPLRQRWALRHATAMDHGGAAQAATQRVAAWSKFIRYSQQSLALAAGALLVIDGELSPGAMIAASVLMTRALAPIDQFLSGWRAFIGARQAFERLEALLQRFPPRRHAHADAAPVRGAFSLREVVAAAPGRAQPVLGSISLSVDAGTVLVVQGPSGSGKSTLARVLMGLWPDVSGEVILSGKALADWDRLQLGPRMGYLPQDIQLLEGTIADNIARYGPIDSAQVVQAARCAGLHELILHLPQGYETPIGEAGGALSGGLRQRVALARALYGEPALLVLDEPDANLDEAGEAALRQAVRAQKARGHTVVLISHHPELLAVADRLLVLHEGRILSDRWLGTAGRAAAAP